MRNNYDDIQYEGPDLDYKPPIGMLYNDPAQVNTYVSKGGYHDLEYLKEILDQVEYSCRSIYSESEKIMSNYALKLDNEDETIKRARDYAFPKEAYSKLNLPEDERVERFFEDPNTSYIGGSKWFNQATGKVEWTNPSTNEKESFDSMEELRESMRKVLALNENFGKYDVNPRLGYISFEEYKYYKHHTEQAAASYVASYYEEKLRSPGGTNALDLSYLAIVINNEVKRIREFIDVYIGEVDDPAEFRAIEIFQNWAENTLGQTQDIWKVLTGKIITEIPKSEVDQLNKEKASGLQALFQVKINVINRNIKDLLGQLRKNWEDTSSIFYHDNLGPALRFQIKVAKNVSNTFTPTVTPVISNEVQGTLLGLSANYNVLLSDQIKRNKLFETYIENILLNISQRDSYSRYIEQFSQKGKPVVNSFTISSGEVSKAFEEYLPPLETTNTSSDFNANVTFDPLHSALAGINAPDAHPQYLLRAGGKEFPITGNIFLAEGVRIDGIIPSKHAHTGTDGSAKITGANIELGTVTDENIDTEHPSTTTPSDLKLISQVTSVVPPGLTKVAARVSFNVDTSNIVQYEFEVVPLPAPVQTIDEIQRIIQSAKIFKDFRKSKQANEVQLPQEWTTASEPVTTSSGKISFDDKGVLLLENSSEINIQTGSFSSAASTLVWYMSRDRGWDLSDYGTEEEGFEIEFINNDETSGILTTARILSVFNSSDQLNIGTVHAQVKYNNEEEKFPQGTTKINDFGDFYDDINGALLFMSFTLNGVILTSFGLTTGKSTKAYSSSLVPQNFNAIKLKTDRNKISSPITPVVRLHAFGIWNEELDENEIDKIASYLLS